MSNLTFAGAAGAALALDHIEHSTLDAGLTGDAAEVAADLRRAPRLYGQLGGRLQERLNAVAADRSLSDEGKGERRAQVLDGWLKDAQRLVAAARTLAGNALKSRRDDVRPAPVHIDATVAEARLANARLDAQMLLDKTPLGKLPEVLEQFARSEDAPALRHLVLVGPFAGLYLRSRNAPGEADNWERDRSKLLGPLLTERGRKAVAELDALGDVAMIPSYLEDLFRVDAAKYGLRID